MMQTPTSGRMARFHIPFIPAWTLAAAAMLTACGGSQQPSSGADTAGAGGGGAPPAATASPVADGAQPDPAAPAQPAAVTTPQQPIQEPVAKDKEATRTECYAGDWDKELNRDKTGALEEPFRLGSQMPPASDSVQTLKDGTTVEILRMGAAGPAVKPFDTVRYRFAAYREDGTLLKGNMADPLCAHQREDMLHKAVPKGDETPLTGLAAAVRLLTPGARARIRIPPGSDAGPVRKLVDPKERSGMQTGEPAFPVVIDFALLDVIQRPALPSVAEDAGEWVTTENGARYRYLKRGDGGARPAHFGVELSWGLWNDVPWLLHYTQQERGTGGMLRGLPGQLPIPVAQEVAAVLKVGDRVVVDCPPELAFGERGNRGIAPNSRTRWVFEAERYLESPPMPDFGAAEVQRTESGLEYFVVEEGDGAKAEAGDLIVAHYGGWLLDGTPFDNSWVREQPLVMAVGPGIIKGWQEGLQLMHIGDTYAFRIPAELAYGERATGNIPPGSTLVFLIELRDANPVSNEFRQLNPEVTQETDSGLKYEVLAEGTGERPGPGDKVMVHYCGWLADGTKFDASADRGRAAEFGVNQVIPGWTEGLQLMREGGHYLFYIPARIGYGVEGSPPKIPGNADLVFAVKLEKVLR